MQYRELADFLEHVGKDPSKLIFEDELTGIHNRRFLLSYLKHKVRWDSKEDYPLSLLIIDMDHFKLINDTHGHEVGDQALTWVASLLKDTAGDDGLPVRYGGDEFMLLLPDADGDRAREVAEKLLRKVADRGFKMRRSGTQLSIAFSIGIATAPQDGRNGRSLFRAADTALYYAKRSGRNQIAGTEDVDLDKVFAKAALYRLEASGIVGREQQLAAMSQALEALALGKSQMLLFEGAPGSGKTAFLETVASNLTNHDLFFVAEASGLHQEGYRPYYLATRVLTELLNQLPDKGEAVIGALDAKQRGYLSHILPGLGADAGETSQDSEETLRAGVFNSLTTLFISLLESRPLVLLLDDLQFADEATLLALRVLLLRDDLNIIVCGTETESLKLGGEDERSPLERFVAARTDELRIRQQKLGALTADDIAHHLRSVFPGLAMPKGFECDLAETTQGNALFLGEVIRKLVVDQKVVLSGKSWKLEKLEEGYLPRSLEEVVNEQIAALDKEGRAILERASLFGEDVPVSILTGGTDGDESAILEFLDRAESLGLVKLNFQLNDETMRFLGKRVLELSYGNIDGKQREALHEEVATYQETLYEQRILPSASLLAYHFKRSANQEKALEYEQIQLSYGQAVFNAEEAAGYSGLDDDDEDAEDRLAPEALAELPKFFRTFVTAVRNVKLYPAESAAIVQAHADIKLALDGILEHNETFHPAQSRNVLLGNGQRLDVSEFSGPARSFLDLLARTDLQGIVFHRGTTEKELGPMLETLSAAASQTVDGGFWKRFVEEQGLEHIDMRQVRYSEVRLAKKKGAPAGLAAPEEELDGEDLQAVPRILRAFRGATANIKLYPIDSDQVTESIAEVHGSLEAILERRRILNLSITERSLLANGVRLTTSTYDALADQFIDFMRQSSLESLTFLSPLKVTELETFFGVLRELSGGTDREFWESCARQQALTTIFFNQREYSQGIIQSLLASELGDAGEAADGSAIAAWAEQIESDPDEALRQALPRFGHDLLAQGDQQLLRRLLQRLFKDFDEQDTLSRQETVNAVGRLVNTLILALQYKFAKVALEPLIAAIEKETDPTVVHELTAILNLFAGTALQFSGYQEAGRIFMALRERHEDLGASGEGEATRTSKLIAPRLDPAVQALLEDDLKSGDPTRQENAAQILGSLGRPGAPLLVEVIKQEKDFRTRQMAATLLGGMGPGAGAVIKRALNVEVTVEQRFRILEVIDIVTHDVHDELAYSLGDTNPKIRRAAFRLADRLRDDGIIDILLPFAASSDPNVVKGAIRSLAQLGSNRAVTAISATLQAATEPELATACCQALGQMGDAGGVAAMEGLLGRRKFGFLGTYWDDQVRATAALSLRQIDDPSATQALSRFTKDRDPRVRQLSRAASPGDSS